MLKCNIMKPEWDKFWAKLLSVAEVHCKQESDVLTHFSRHLDDSFSVLV